MENKLKNILLSTLPLMILLIACLFSIGSSPLFQTNPWDDSNAMLTMGRSALHGLVPFKDLVEQRGPFLYIVYGFGALLSATNFFGLFILELINILIIYWISLKLAKDFNDRAYVANWLALFGPFALIGTSAFCLGGAPEEFAFTSVLYLLYVVKHYGQNVEEIPTKTYFILGLNLSLIFWNKYSMIGSFVAFFIWTAVVLLSNRKFVQLGRIVLISFAGFFSVTLFFVLYFYLNHALGDLIRIYFFQNIVSYGKYDQTMLMKIFWFFRMIAIEVRLHFLVILIIFIGWRKAVYHREKIALEIFMMSGAFFFVALGPAMRDYYNIIWMPFFVVALLRLMALPRVQRIAKNKQYAIAIFMSLLILVSPIVNNRLIHQLVLKGTTRSLDGHRLVAQSQFAQIMSQNTKREEPSILLINTLDKGFFLATKSLPKTLYWHRMNMSYEQLPKMYRNFEQSMNKRQVEFVVVKLTQQPSSDSQILKKQISDAIDPHLKKALFENYRVLSSAANYKDEYYVLLMEK